MMMIRRRVERHVLSDLDVNFVGDDGDVFGRGWRRAVDIVPLVVLGLIERHQVDALLAWRVHAAIVGELDECGLHETRVRLRRVQAVTVADDSAALAVNVVPHGLLALIERHEIDALLLGRVDAALIGPVDHTFARHVLVGDHVAALAVDVVPVVASRLSARHEVDALLVVIVDAADVGAIDHLRPGHQIVSVGHDEARLTLDKVPLFLDRLAARHKVHSLAHRTVDAAGVRMLGAQAVHVVSVGDHLARLAVDVVPVGLARLVGRHQVDALVFGLVHAVLVGAVHKYGVLVLKLVAVGDHATVRPAVDVVPRGLARLVVRHQVDALLHGRQHARYVRARHQRRLALSGQKDMFIDVLLTSKLMK